MSNNKPEASIPVEFKKWLDAELDRQWHSSPNITKEQLEIAMGVGYNTYRHLSSQSSPGLWWVKASERMPDPSIKVIYRGKDGIIREDSYDAKEFSFLFREMVEWLEEIPSAQPREEEHKGFYCHDKDHGVSEEKCISQCEDCGGKAKAQPIADSKEVPEEIVEWVNAFKKRHENVLVLGRREALLLGIEEGAIAMYNKVEEELEPLAAKFEVLNNVLLHREKEAVDQKIIIESHGRVITKMMNELAAKETQIAGLVVSNQELGEKYEAMQIELLAYQKIDKP